VSNQPKTGDVTARVQDRHGRKGHVSLSTSVPPHIKTHLVEAAEFRSITLKQAIQEALEQWLYEVRR